VRSLAYLHTCLSIFLRTGLSYRRVIDLGQQGFDAFLGGRGFEGDGGRFGVGVGLNGLDPSQIADFHLDGVDAMSAGNIGDAVGYSCHGKLLWVDGGSLEVMVD
jgi:hypothetical protein